MHDSSESIIEEYYLTYNMLKEIDVKLAMQEVDNKGFIQNLRDGDTGVGYTLEETWGIVENNAGEPDLIYNGLPVELKAQRTSATSRVTLITKTPHWDPLSPKEIIQKFGYIDKNRRQALKITLYSDSFNNQGFKLEFYEDRLNIVHKTGGVVAYFDIQELMDKLHEKLYENLLLVLADNKRINGKEYFHYKSALLLTHLSADAFKKLFKEGLIVWEFRMHIKENGSVRDHGPGFRLSRLHIKKLYDNSLQIYP